MFILTKKTVTLRGVDVPPGEVIEVDDKSGAALINEDAGEAYRGGKEGTPDGDQGGQEENQGGEAAEVGRIRAAIEAQYKRDELAEAAKAVGVDFAYDAKKGEIIQAVIDQDKVAAILK